jgi:hypothetical protein
MLETKRPFVPAVQVHPTGVSVKRNLKEPRATGRSAESEVGKGDSKSLTNDPDRQCVGGPRLSNTFSPTANTSGEFDITGLEDSDER